MGIEDINDALKLAELAHTGQLRADGKTEYMAHIRRGFRIISENNTDEREQILYILHDSLEKQVDPTKKMQLTEEIKKRFPEFLYQLQMLDDTQGNLIDHELSSALIKELITVRLADISENLEKLHTFETWNQQKKDEWIYLTAQRLKFLIKQVRML